MKSGVKLAQGERVVDMRTQDEYIFESYDLMNDIVHLVNWFGQKSISGSEFYAYFELDLKLPAGTENKSLQLDFDMCDHEYVEYNGLREAFKYCKKCDKRA